MRFLLFITVLLAYLIDFGVNSRPVLERSKPTGRSILCGIIVGILGISQPHHCLLVAADPFPNDTKALQVINPPPVLYPFNDGFRASESKFESNFSKNEVKKSQNRRSKKHHQSISGFKAAEEQFERQGNKNEMERSIKDVKALNADEHVEKVAHASFE